MNAATRFALTVAIALGFASMSFAAGNEAHWGYTGKEGADKWGDLKQEFATCKLGKEQSPIDIRDKDAVKSKLDAITFDYRPSPLRIIDNGHTIQVNYAPGSSISVGGSRYELLQFHFHKPSEEKVNGKAYAMVAHLVHKNKEGKLAVVGVLLDTGKENPMLKTLWSTLPQQKEKEMALDQVSIDVSTLLPGDRNYYTFAGSLTTPPCSESVTWFVLKNAVQASQGQFDAFGKLYSMNARPVQPVNGRVIKVSN
jgi:carbonic anhydrase